MTIRVLFTNAAGKMTETICKTMTEAVALKTSLRAQGLRARIYHS